MKLGDLVEIVWEDHCTCAPNGWADIEKEYTPAIIKTVGYVIAITPKYVTLSATYDVDSKMISGWMLRLRSAIIKSKVLKGLK